MINVLPRGYWCAACCCICPLSTYHWNDFQNVQDVLALLRTLYALIILEEDASFLRYGYLSVENAAVVRQEVIRLCSELRPHALALVSSFGIPDAFLSPIAFDWIDANSWSSVQQWFHNSWIQEPRSILIKCILSYILIKSVLNELKKGFIHQYKILRLSIKHNEIVIVWMFVYVLFLE